MNDELKDFHYLKSDRYTGFINPQGRETFSEDDLQEGSPEAYQAIEAAYQADAEPE